MTKSIGSDLINIIKDESFVIMHNGIITSTNMDLKNLVLTKDFKFVLIHQLDSDCNIDITINNNCKVYIKEILFAEKEVSIKKNIKVLENGYLDIVTIEHNQKDNIEINAKTTMESGSYINSMKLSIYLGPVIENEAYEIKGNKAHLENYNVYINSSTCEQSIDNVVTHLGNDSESIMTNYGICKGKSILNINTNGKIKKDAKRTNLRQKSKGILLDKEATIAANPWLQIDEFDCLASHGAGIGAIDEEELYYLMSRGLTRFESEKLIINGFVYPIYEHIENSNLKKMVMELTDKYL